MLYKLARAIFKVFLAVLGLKTEGLHKLPKKGPVIIAANHMSNWDPVLVGVAIKRPIHFISKAELFDNRIMSIILTRLNAFPVKRGSTDIKAIRYALDLLKQGNILGIFPEGARKKLYPDAVVQTGVAMFALKSGAPVIPVACIGTGSTFPLGWFKPLLVRVGDPINLGEYLGKKINSNILQDASLTIMNEINLLLEQ
ncbi:MAG: lysophospholipid acyltransferase family protein [Deltaproteobacteria bacterium]